jgi:glycosyltransferase involved in cell wall biosynthesis
LKISVIICTYSFQRLNDLRELITSLQKQNYPKKEIIVAVDRNKDLYDHLKKTLPTPVKTVLATASGTSEARNAGILVASGEAIAFIDDDGLPDANWLSSMSEIFEKEPNCGALTGPIFPLWKTVPPNWFTKEFWWIVSCTYIPETKKRYEVRNGIGTNLAFRTRIFKDVGLFDPAFGKKEGKDIIADETELCVRMTLKAHKTVLYDTGLVTRHKVYGDRLSVKSIMKRAYYDGYSKSLLTRKYSTGALSTEIGYFSHLLTVFFPQLIKDFFRHPIRSFGAFSNALSIIFSFAVGYLMPKKRYNGQ